MYLQNRFTVGLFALFLALASLAVSTANAAVTITIVANFDYPGAGVSTFPFGINNAGDIAGYYTDASGVSRGFVRYRNGSLTSPIVEPNDTGGFTRCNGINSARTVTGDYFNIATNAYHGYLLTSGVFTQYDVNSDPLSTSLFGVNDAGHLTGGFGSFVQANQAFITINGVATVINIPGSVDAGGHGINNVDQVAGSYLDAAGVNHGFLRNANGSLVAPIDVPQSTSTIIQSISDSGYMVGRYKKAGVDHGFILKLPRTIITYDYPGASATSFNGINAKGMISGRYTDSLGIAHGFMAQAQIVP